MGRFVAFLARIVQDGWSAGPRGIAIDSKTAVLVERSGAATVVASPGDVTPYAYFMHGGARRRSRRPRHRSPILNLPVYRGTPTGTFNLATGTGKRRFAFTVSVNAGVLTSSRPGGEIY